MEVFAPSRAELTLYGRYNVRAGAVNHVTMAYKILRAKSRRISAHNWSDVDVNASSVEEADARSDSPNAAARLSRLEQEQREREINETAAAMTDTDTLRPMTTKDSQKSPTRDAALARSFMPEITPNSEIADALPPSSSCDSTPASAPRLLVRHDSGSDSEGELDLKL